MPAVCEKTLVLQATAPVKLQVEEALNKGIGSFQELLQQQKDTLRQLQQDYNSYTAHACVHPSVVVAQRESGAVGQEAAAAAVRSTRVIMRQVTCCTCHVLNASCDEWPLVRMLAA